MKRITLILTILAALTLISCEQPTGSTDATETPENEAPEDDTDNDSEDADDPTPTEAVTAVIVHDAYAQLLTDTGSDTILSGATDVHYAGVDPAGRRTFVTSSETYYYDDAGAEVYSEPTPTSEPTAAEWHDGHLWITETIQGTQCTAGVAHLQYTRYYRDGSAYGACADHQYTVSRMYVDDAGELLEHHNGLGSPYPRGETTNYPQSTPSGLTIRDTDQSTGQTLFADSAGASWVASGNEIAERWTRHDGAWYAADGSRWSYEGGWSDTPRAYEAHTGTLLGSHGGWLYVADDAGDVYRWDSSTDTVESRGTSGTTGSIDSALVAGDRIYIASEGSVYRYNPLSYGPEGVVAAEGELYEW